MEVTIQLKKIAMDHGFYNRGIVNELAKDLGIHRHSVRKLLNSEAKAISMKTLGDLCRWLQAKGVPGEELPQAMFAARPAQLWKAVAGTGNVTIYLGEYQQILGESEKEAVRLWVSRRDSAVANAITEQLYELHDQARTRKLLRTEYVPFRFETSAGTGRSRYFEEDTARAMEKFETVRSHSANSASILIGSQEVNGLVEVLVADLFGCAPFIPAESEVRVPFHLVFRSRHSDISSCFGSYERPPGFTGEATPGIYHLDKKGKWVVSPWVSDRQDAGIVITLGDPAANSMELAMFGFSGRATAAMASLLVPSPQPIWPPYCRWGGKELGVYICRFTLDPGSRTAVEPLQKTNMEVIRLDEAILRKRLPCRERSSHKGG